MASYGLSAQLDRVSATVTTVAAMPQGAYLSVAELQPLVDMLAKTIVIIIVSKREPPKH
jgi:hypothetical protein